MQTYIVFTDALVGRLGGRTIKTKRHEITASNISEASAIARKLHTLSAVSMIWPKITK